MPGSFWSSETSKVAFLWFFGTGAIGSYFFRMHRVWTSGDLSIEPIIFGFEIAGTGKNGD